MNTTKQFIGICEILESARTIYKIWSMFLFSTVWFFSFAKKKNHLNRINWKNVMENSVWSEKTNKMKEIEILFHCSRILYENKYIQFKFSKKKNFPE